MNRSAIVVTALALSATLFAPSAHADDTIKHPGDHPNYVVEIEPHLIVGWYRSVGVGARFNFALMKNGPIPSINNNLALGVGAELQFLGYTQRVRGYYFREGGAFLSVPVTMQWNFFVHERWSVFPELGVAFNHGFYDCEGACGGPIFVDIVGAVGARYHFSESTALTFRAGYPGITVGLSFF